MYLNTVCDYVSLYMVDERHFQCFQHDCTTYHTFTFADLVKLNHY